MPSVLVTILQTDKAAPFINLKTEMVSLTCVFFCLLIKIQAAQHCFSSKPYEANEMGIY